MCLHLCPTGQEQLDPTDGGPVGTNADGNIVVSLPGGCGGNAGLDFGNIFVQLEVYFGYIVAGIEVYASHVGADGGVSQRNGGHDDMISRLLVIFRFVHRQLSVLS